MTAGGEYEWKGGETECKGCGDILETLVTLVLTGPSRVTPPPIPPIVVMLPPRVETP
jgi:hypothetical protein